MSKRITGIVKDGNTVELGARDVNISISEDIVSEEESKVVIPADSDLSTTLKKIVGYVDEKTLSDWVATYQDSSGNSHDFLAHRGNEGGSWGTSGDIVFDPIQGGATFGTTSRANTENILNAIGTNIDNNKQPNALEIGLNNSAMSPGANSVIIGTNNQSMHNNTLLVGNKLNSTRDNQLLVGEASIPEIVTLYSYTTDADLYAKKGNISDLKESQLEYGDNMVFAVGAGNDNNTTDEKVSSYALQVFDAPEPTNRDNSIRTSTIPNALVNINGSLKVNEGSIHTPYAYVTQDLVAQNLIVKGVTVFDALSTDGYNEDLGLTIDSETLKQVLNLKKTYDEHTHNLAKIDISNNVEEVKFYEESGLLEQATVSDVWGWKVKNITINGETKDSADSVIKASSVVNAEHPLNKFAAISGVKVTDAIPGYFGGDWKTTKYDISNFRNNGLPSNKIQYYIKADTLNKKMTVDFIFDVGFQSTGGKVYKYFTYSLSDYINDSNVNIGRNIAKLFDFSGIKFDGNILAENKNSLNVECLNGYCFDWGNVKNLSAATRNRNFYDIFNNCNWKCHFLPTTLSSTSEEEVSLCFNTNGKNSLSLYSSWKSMIGDTDAAKLVGAQKTASAPNARAQYTQAIAKTNTWNLRIHGEIPIKDITTKNCITKYIIKDKEFDFSKIETTKPIVVVPPTSGNTDEEGQGGE